MIGSTDFREWAAHLRRSVWSIEQFVNEICVSVFGFLKLEIRISLKCAHYLRFVCVCARARVEAYETEGPRRTSELDSSSRGPRPWWWRAGFFISHFLIINSNHGLFITHRGAIAPLKAGGTFGFPVVLITLQDRGEGVTDDSHDNNARAPVLCPPALRLTENERCFHLFPLSSDWRRLCGLDFIISSSSLSSSILSDANLILIECYSAYTAIYSVPQSSGSVNFLVTKTPHHFTCLNVFRMLKYVFIKILWYRFEYIHMYARIFKLPIDK